MPEQVLVVGCGVIGLSSAIRLQEAGCKVSIITRDLPPNVTSAVAGAMWYGHASHSRIRQWAHHGLDVYFELAQQPNTGVLIRQLREVFAQPVEIPWFARYLPFFEHLPANDLPQGFVDGFLMDIPIIETPTYLRYMMRRFTEGGGIIEQHELKSLDELDAPLIVNCTGVWARQVVNDSSVYPIRGQVLKVEAPQIQQGYMDDENFTYIFPRHDGVILGGVAQVDNWSLEPDAAISADILARCAEIEPSVREAKVIATLVGLRPGRREVRLERERGARGIIIHNYGHAGVGVTLSWGSAREVVQLAAE
jgi:D-amino-acid oxidase